MRKQIMKSLCPSCGNVIQVDLETPVPDKDGACIHLNHPEPKCAEFDGQDYDFVRSVLQRGIWVSH